jgi:hypothetical protein
MSPPTSLDTPRWEWRTFVDSLGEAEARIRFHRLAGVGSCIETHVVSSDGPWDARIRDGALRLRRLERSAPDGLELWSPALAWAFPLGEDGFAAACAAWGVKAHAPQGGCSAERLLEDVVARHPRLAAVVVAQERFTFDVDGCPVELAHLTFDGSPVRTAAVVHEDPERARATLHALGLSNLENVNYVRALRRFRALRAA